MDFWPLSDTCRFVFQILFQSKQTMVLQSAAPNLTLRPQAKVPIPMTSKLIPANTIKLSSPKVITATKASPTILRTQNRPGVQLLQPMQSTPNSNVTYVLQGNLLCKLTK